jgi:hypothetical protein
MNWRLEFDKDNCLGTGLPEFTQGLGGSRRLSIGGGGALYNATPLSDIVP